MSMRFHMNLISKYYEALTPQEWDTLRSCFEDTEGMVSLDEAVLLYCLAKDVDAGCVVEVGSYRGRSTVFLGRGSLAGSSVPVYAVDPHRPFVGVLGGIFGPKDRTAFYGAMLKHDCSEIVSLINLSSDQFSSSWNLPISLLWIDGDHSYEGVKQDFLCWEPHLAEHALVAFDDATDPNLGPRRLIDELLASSTFYEVMSVGKAVIVRRGLVKG